MPDAPLPDDTALGTQSATLEVGRRVFGQYVLKRFLNRGPLGSAWLVGQEGSGRELTMRFVPEGWLREERVIVRLREAVARALEITHPGLVGVLDLVRDSQAAAIVSNFVEAQTALDAKSQRQERHFEIDSLRPWLTQVCEALDFAWCQHRAVHGDLCPANLLVTSLGEMKIADFGLARCLADFESPAGGPLLTPVLAFASPERARGAAVTVTDDVYAFGATVYDLVTSHPPFFQGNLREQVESVIAPRMAERRAELGLGGDAIAPEWEEVIAACLAKRPEDRPKSVREIGERLGLLGPLPPALPPEPEPTPATVDENLDLEATVTEEPAPGPAATVSEPDLEATMAGNPAPPPAPPQPTEDDSSATIAAEEPLPPVAPAPPPPPPPAVVPPAPAIPKNPEDSVTFPTPPEQPATHPAPIPPATEPKPAPLPPPIPPAPRERSGVRWWWFAAALVLAVIALLPFAARKSPAPAQPTPVPTTPIAEVPQPTATQPVIATPVPATPAPAFRTIVASDLADLADKGPASEPLLLAGTFRVSSANSNHLILRPAESALTGQIRVMATLRPSANIPAEGSTLTLTNTSRYFVRAVRRGADGQLNVEAEQR